MPRRHAMDRSIGFRFLLTLTASLTALTLMTEVASAASQAPHALMNVKATEVKAAQAGWHTKDTWVNHLSKSEVQRLLGLKTAPATDVQFSTPQKALVTSNDSLDWRNKDGRNWMSPVMNQGNCGSCVAFASIGTLTTQMNISANIPGLNAELSPQALFACGGGMCEYGWMPSDAADYLKETGVPDEACAPYMSGATGNDVSCGTVCKDAASRSVRIASFTQPTRGSTNIDAVKAALRHGPLVTTLTVYADLLTYANGVYKHVTGEALGGHAVSLVGYDDATRSFLIRNSWGPEWGDNGFVRISYDDISGIASETWSYSMPPAGGYVAIDNVRDLSYWSGSMPIHAFSTFPDATALVIDINNSSGQRVAGVNCASVKECSGSIDTTALADGRYDISATASKAGVSLGKSIASYFYVANKPNQLALSFVAESTTNINKPIAGRVVFDITTQSSNVPMSHLIFNIKDASGHVATRKSSQVLPKMTLGWRTNPFPNGTYEIWMTGHVQTQNSDQSVDTPHVSIVINN